MSRRLLLIAAASISLTTTFPQFLYAQSPQPAHATVSKKWVLLDAIGYGGLGTAAGMVVGLATASGCGFGPCDLAVLAVLGGAATGAFVGTAIGSDARNTVAMGKQLTPGRRGQVIAGAILAGSTLGAIASIKLISGKGSGTPLGSDEQTFGMLALGGTAVGAVMAAQCANELIRLPVTVSPVVGPGRYGLGAQVAF